MEKIPLKNMMDLFPYILVYYKLNPFLKMDMLMNFNKNKLVIINYDFQFIQVKQENLKYFINL